MPSMDYFRRPQVSGKNVTRTTNAVLRGSLRRSNADGVSAVPYFPAASAAQTLNVSIDGTPFVATLTANGINTVIANINTAIGVAGTAFDSDGTISIRSATAGTPSSVEVTGGSAATALGFDVTLGGLRTTGGDIPSSPEGRIGNAFGIGFPNTSENLTSESVNRALARVSANSDVLFADLMRHDVVLKPVSFSTSDRRLLTLTASQRVFIGSPGFFTGANPTKEELVPYYQVIDNSTGQPAQSRVVGVVRGSPAGVPPFAAATTWVGGGSAGSVINTSFDKVTAAAITNISNGRIVSCSAANFADVVVGDFAEITGATNTSPVSNNGDKWVVEQVINATTLALRPLTAAQISGVGATPTTEVQPIVELNSFKTGPESWGSLSIYNGFYTSQAQLVVDPPLPSGGSFTVLCAVPRTFRERQPFDEALNTRAALVPLVSDDDLVENWTLSGLVATPSGPNLAVTAGKIRWNGRVYSLPARSFVPGDFTNNTRNYLYWDEATADYAISTSVASFGFVLDSVTSTGRGHLVAIVDLSAGAITSILPSLRLRAEKAIPLTVGTGGQFTTLKTAADFVSAITANYAGETTTLTGTYPHFEIILVSNVFAGSSEIPRFKTVGLTIRGINDRVLLDMGVLSGAIEFDGKSLEVRDLRVGSASPGPAFITTTGVGSTIDKITLKNITQTSGYFTAVVKHDVFEATVAELNVERCAFSVSVGLSSCTGGASAGIPTVRVSDSTFAYTNGGSQPRFVYSALGPSNWNGTLFEVRNCSFTGSWGGSTAWGGTNAFFIHTSNAASVVRVEHVQWESGAQPSTVTTRLFDLGSATAFISNFRMTLGKIPMAVQGGFGTVVEDSSFTTNTASGQAGIIAQKVTGCIVDQVDLNSAGVAGTGIRAAANDAVISDNTLTGGFVVGISNSTPRSGVRITNNRISILSLTNSTGSASGASPTAILTGAAAVDVLVSGNSITIAAGVRSPGLVAAGGIAPTAGGTGSTDTLTITDNRITIENPNNPSTTFYGISIGTGLNVNCSGNSIFSSLGVADTAQVVVGIGMEGAQGASVTSNDIVLTGETTMNWTGILFGDMTNCLVASNRVEVWGAPVNTNLTTTNVTNEWTGNQFITTTTNGADALCKRLNGVVTSNRFSQTGGVPNVVSIGAGNFIGNVFDEVTVVFGVSEPTTPIRFESNRVISTFTFTSAPASLLDVSFSDNYIGSTFSSDVRGDLKFVGNRFVGSFTISSTQTRELSFNSCIFDSSFTAQTSGTAASNYLTLVGCVISGQVTVSNAANVDMTGCFLRSSSGTSITANSCHINGSKIFNRLTLNFLAEASINSNVIDGGINFTGDTGSLRFTIVGNRIRTASDIPGIQFLAYTVATGNRIDISDNTILVGELTPSGNTVAANGIAFLGDMQEVRIVGNTILLSGAPTTDPGGSGTFEYGCVRCVGATNNYHFTISSNMFDIPSNKTYRAAALNINYHFWRFGQAQEVGGAGNTLSRNGAWPSNTAPYNGDHFVQYASATPYSVS